MLALLSPRLWAAIALCAAVALCSGIAYRAGRSTVQAAWDGEKLQIAKIAKEAESENRKIESARARNVIDAQNAANTRNARLQADAGSARNELVGLRNAIAAIDSVPVPGGACNADRDNATAAHLLLSVCAAELTELAGKADAAVSDVLTLQSAWPK